MLRKLLESVIECREVLLIILVFLGGMSLFLSVINPQEIKNPDMWIVRDNPVLSLIIVGISLIITSLVGVYLTKDKSKRKLPNISGYWHYRVVDEANKPSHTGKCRITISRGVANFIGIRRYVVEERAGKRGALEKNWDWNTTWTDYGSDGWFRCEYKFKSFNGYFKINFHGDESIINVFEGTYYLLTDSVERYKTSPNAPYGTIRYERVEKNKYDDVSPPDGLEIWAS